MATSNHVLTQIAHSWHVRVLSDHHPKHFPHHEVIFKILNMRVPWCVSGHGGRHSNVRSLLRCESDGGPSVRRRNGSEN